MLFRRNLIITIFSLFVISFACFAQNTSYIDSLEGKYALQFQISNNFNLTNFQGSTFSGKYHFGRRSAVRLGLSIDLLSDEYETTITLLDTSSITSTNAKQDGFGMTLKAQYVHYIPRINDISFFLGGGPFISFNNTTAKTNNPDIEPVYFRKDEIDNFTIGLDLLIGVEWMFSRNISLSAEYGIQFYHNSHTTKSEILNRRRESTEKQNRITKGDLNFGISVYF